ncbi:hypothetical protein FNJ84_06855 [Paracoccus sp. M683]|uniref:hypothetical protein n=1 Tax=Paracoccus sp. M683 TaxID=2594268 RepID=UPI00117F7D9C|nr:hypothetical protein [Paracoccus sp. M683]TRW97238.1 hypothetical protein FNJ84_06855 [Paracoccus sp. M683]
MAFAVPAALAIAGLGIWLVVVDRDEFGAIFGGSILLFLFLPAVLGGLIGLLKRPDRTGG